jgi:hypothetical protein
MGRDESHGVKFHHLGPSLGSLSLAEDIYVSLSGQQEFKEAYGANTPATIEDQRGMARRG